MAATCWECLSARHRRCERDGCACNICGYVPAPRAKVSTPKPARKVAAEPKAPAGPRVWPKKPGPIPGAHGLKGRSTLSEEHQAKVALLHANGVSISQIARSLGCSRDKVRTIIQRQAELSRRVR